MLYTLRYLQVRDAEGYNCQCVACDKFTVLLPFCRALEHRFLLLDSPEFRDKFCVIFLCSAQLAKEGLPYNI